MSCAQYPLYAIPIMFAQGSHHRPIEMIERGDFAIVLYGYAVPRALPQISNIHYGPGFAGFGCYRGESR